MTLTLTSILMLSFPVNAKANAKATQATPEPVIIRMAPKQSDEDVSHSYLVSLLELAIKETEHDFGPAKLDFMPIQLGQNLVLPLLDIEGILDTVASAPTRQREIQFRAARFPLLMGLLGYRMMLIRPEDEAKFLAISRPEQLKVLKACQGSSWPDSAILEEQGYNVIRVEKFETMFDYLHSGRCDYFPRAITEGYGELDAYNSANPDKPLLAFDKVLLHYTVPLFFFTSHKNFLLAYRIETGLIRANEKGLVEQLMRSHPVTKSAYPLQKWQSSVVFEVANPHLLKTIPIEHKQYWQSLPTRKMQ
ncbi:hypothetical protein VEZ01S_42_00010 [Vibrio ezurae NBRC 102218]|uniref:Solute-binding protein family 3/N-terminal domain-containing protein n=1 Tax=Vibrio ezurae NBRC 102218 TaxID=1219080 RepID=U3ALK5_9VIBR|nr:hypothetical protein VEZ01S_42_00010 [Vibrio ezurae NBRC 102218]